MVLFVCRSELTEENRIGELGKKQLNKLVNTICNDGYLVNEKLLLKKSLLHGKHKFR